jgi:excisionase family DNA binding protein
MPQTEVAPTPVTLLTIEEVCSTLRQSRASVYRKIGAGELRAVRLGSQPNAPLRVRVAEFERYLAAHVVEPAGARQ